MMMIDMEKIKAELTELESQRSSLAFRGVPDEETRLLFALMDDIEALRGRGVTWKQITPILEKHLDKKLDYKRMAERFRGLKKKKDAGKLKAEYYAIDQASHEKTPPLVSPVVPQPSPTPPAVAESVVPRAPKKERAESAVEGKNFLYCAVTPSDELFQLMPRAHALGAGKPGFAICKIDPDDGTTITMQGEGFPRPTADKAQAIRDFYAWGKRMGYDVMENKFVG